MISRHSIRSVAAVFLAGGALVGSLLGASAAQAVTPASYHAFAGGYQAAGSTQVGAWGYAVEGQVVSPGPLNVRSGPGADYWINATISNGTIIWIGCKTEGTDIGGNDHWYRLAGGEGWVSAYYVDHDDYIPWCDA